MAKDWYPPPGTRLGATVYVRRPMPWLGHYFGVAELEDVLSPGIGGVVSWGWRTAATLARFAARMRGLAHWHAEDGYLRSVGLGKEGALPISVIVDDLGTPLDASKPSRLERLIAGGTSEGGADIRAAITGARLSKYNNLPHRALQLDRTARRRLLLVDQVKGDVSVPMAGASGLSFSRMVEDALASGAQCVLRTHPDVMAGFREGYLTEQAARLPGVILSAEAVSVDSVLSVVDEVWTVSSQFGLDALMRGLPVRCYGASFYAGWGLTEDRLSGAAANRMQARRQARPGLDQLVAAVFSLYPSYRDTKTWQEIDVFSAIERLAAERRALEID